MSLRKPSLMLKGLWLSLSAGLLWGFSGISAQFLIQNKYIDTQWLVSVRMLSAGLLIIIFYLVKNRNFATIFSIFKNKKDLKRLFLLAVLGMLAVQYTYFQAIHFSNASTATVLQYLGPLIMALIVAFQQRRLPGIEVIVSIFMALGGTFILVTHGHPGSLVISPSAVVWGILSAIAVALNGLLPIPLLRKYSPILLTGWSMFLGGIFCNFTHPFWVFRGHYDKWVFFNVGFIIIFGSLLPFCMYMVGVKFLGAVRASLVSCVEPVFATILTVLIFKLAFVGFDWIGTLFIILSILILSIKPLLNKIGRNN